MRLEHNALLGGLDKLASEVRPGVSRAPIRRCANFFGKRADSSCTHMLKLVDYVRGGVRGSDGVELEHEVIVWRN